MLARVWRAWRARARLVAPFYRMPRDGFYDLTLHYDELRSEDGDPRPALPPYAGLASVWHEYSRYGQPDYAPFLTHVAADRGLELRSVLDLACGTGVLTGRLADAVPEVVGLDASGPMLAVARERCAGRPGVSFVEADFRSFHLGRRFDAAVCAFNSLNYVADAGELAAVFRAVAAHLRPGGVLLFDTVTEVAMRMLSGLYLHVEQGGTRFALQFRYDADRRREESVALMPGGDEPHVRVPIDPPDVAAAAKASGLRVDDYFSSAFWPGWWWTGPSCFFVLSNPG